MRQFQYFRSENICESVLHRFYSKLWLNFIDFYSTSYRFLCNVPFSPHVTEEYDVSKHNNDNHYTVIIKLHIGFSIKTVY